MKRILLKIITIKTFLKNYHHNNFDTGLYSTSGPTVRTIDYFQNTKTIINNSVYNLKICHHTI